MSQIFENMPIWWQNHDCYFAIQDQPTKKTRILCGKNNDKNYHMCTIRKHGDGFYYFISILFVCQNHDYIKVLTSFTATEEDAWSTNQSNVNEICSNFDQYEYDACLRLMAKIYKSIAKQYKN